MSSCAVRTSKGSPYGELHPGSFQVPTCLRNLSAHPIMISAKIVIGKVAPANLVPPVTPLMRTLEESVHDLRRLRVGFWINWTYMN